MVIEKASDWVKTDGKLELDGEKGLLAFLLFFFKTVFVCLVYIAKPGVANREEPKQSMVYKWYLCEVANLKKVWYKIRIVSCSLY